MWVIKVPTKVPISKKGSFILNLNHYRNAHYHTLHRAKEKFEEIVTPLVRALPKLGSIELTFTLFPRTNARADTSNVCCIIDKFFCDTLVNAGIIEDDNKSVVLSVSYRYGHVDKSDPRVEITIHPRGELPECDLQEENQAMQIKIVQAEIEEAIRNHILSSITINEGMEISISLSATRGDEGMTAVIDITPPKTPSKPAPKTAPVQAAAPSIPKIAKPTPAPTSAPAPTPETEPETEQVEEAVEEEATPERSVEEILAAEPDEEEEHVEEVVAAKPATKSLFGNLKKPVNS